MNNRHGSESGVGTVLAESRNDDKASKFRSHRSRIWSVIGDRKIRMSKGLKGKTLAKLLNEFAEKIRRDRSGGDRLDYELITFASQVYCPWMIDMNLWAVSELIIRARNPEDLNTPKGFLAKERDIFGKYGAEDDQWAACESLEKMLAGKADRLRMKKLRK